MAAARRTIVVVGASYSGTELAVQLRALADAAAQQMGFDPGSVRFVLLDLAEQDGGVFRRTIIKTADPDRYGIRVGDYYV